MKIPFYCNLNKSIEVGNVEGCPFCGKTDKLRITDKDNFEEAYAANGRACISLDCARCNSELTEHDYDGDDYGVKVGILVTKWNNRRYKNVGD